MAGSGSAFLWALPDTASGEIAGIAASTLGFYPIGRSRPIGYVHGVVGLRRSSMFFGVKPLADRTPEQLHASIKNGQAQFFRHVGGESKRNVTKQE